MPKRDKKREMEERLARIEDGLTRSDLNYAIRQLGGRLDVFNFNPSEKVESLPLYESALAIDGKSYLPEGFANRLEGLYGRIQSAFEDYQREKAKAAIAPGKVTKQESIDAVVDDEIEAIPF